LSLGLALQQKGEGEDLVGEQKVVIRVHRALGHGVQPRRSPEEVIVGRESAAMLFRGGVRFVL
jgi:hypothetical protein